MNAASASTHVTPLWSSYQPHADQLRFHRATNRFRAIVAGRRAGKTLACAAELLAMAYEDARARGPGRRYWAVAPTFGQVDVLLDALRVVTPAALIEEWRAAVTHRLPCVRLRGGIRIEFVGSDHPTRLVGVGLDGAWLDEAALMKPEVWLSQVRPMLGEREGRAIFSTTPRGHGWFHEHICRHEGPRDGGAAFYWPTSANTREPALLTDVEHARATLPERYFRREFEASCEAYEGQIYSDWDAKRHTFAGPVNPVRYRRVVAGIDWGYRNPGAILVVGVTGDGLYEVIAEEIASGRPLDEWRETWKRIVREHRVRVGWADPSEPEHVRSLDEVARCAPADHRVHAGIAIVAVLLHRNRLRVHTGCVKTIQSLRDYRWREETTRGVGHEEPAAGQFDHPADALRYALVMEERGPSVRALV